MHMAHLSGNTSGVSKSSLDWLNSTGFLPGNKNAVAPNSLTKEKSHHVYNCGDECLFGSTKRWILKSMWSIESSRHRIFKMCPRVLHTGHYCCDISTPRNVTLKLNELWLVVWHGWAFSNELGFQTFSRQSEGLTMRDYVLCCSSIADLFHQDQTY